MVVPMRIQRQVNIDEYHDGATFTEVTFVPMLISIKCHSSFPDGEVTKECQKLTARAEKDGLCELSGALCLLIVFGSSQSNLPYLDNSLKSDTLYKDLAKGKVVVGTIRVPLDDEFGLSALFNDLTPQGQMDSELLAAHPFLKGHGRTDKKEEGSALNSEKALYSHASVRWKAAYTLLKESLWTKKPKQALEQQESTTGTAVGQSNKTQPSGNTTEQDVVRSKTAKHSSNTTEQDVVRSKKAKRLSNTTEQDVVQSKKAKRLSNTTEQDVARSSKVKGSRKK